jgi:hypothetical protein
MSAFAGTSIYFHLKTLFLHPESNERFVKEKFCWNQWGEALPYQSNDPLRQQQRKNISYYFTTLDIINDEMPQNSRGTGC